MPRPRLGAKFVGTTDADGNATEFHMGVSSRDYTLDEFNTLDDETKVLMRDSKLFELRPAAEQEADDADAHTTDEVGVPS